MASTSIQMHEYYKPELVKHSVSNEALHLLQALGSLPALSCRFPLVKHTLEEALYLFHSRLIQFSKDFNPLLTLYLDTHRARGGWVRGMFIPIDHALRIVFI